MILGLGVPELVIILVVVLVIFGPKNLPKIGSALGKTVKKPASDDDAIDVVADVDDADADVEDTQFCGECGAKNPAGAAFCSKCGHKFGE